MMDFIKQHLLILGAALVGLWYFCFSGKKKSYRRGRSRRRGRSFNSYGRRMSYGRRY